MRVFHSLCSRKRQEPQRCTSNAALQNYNIHGYGMEESAQQSLSDTSHTITIRLTEELASIAGRRTAKPSFLPHLEMGEPRFSGRDSTKTLTKLWCAALKATGLPGWVSLPMIRPCPYATLDPRMCTRLTGRQCSCKFRLFDLAAFPFPCPAGLEDLPLNTEHCATTPPTRRRRFRYGSHVFPAHPRRGDICRAAVGKTKSPDAAPLGLEAFSSRPPTLLRHYRARPSSTT